MKQHLGLGIIVAVSALMVFGTTAYVMPFVYAVSSSRQRRSPLEPVAHLPLAPRVVLVEKEIIQVVALAQQVQAQVLAQAAGPTPKTPAPKTPTPKTPAPKTPAPKTPAPKACVPGKCVGDPGYYTTNGHHHCFDGANWMRLYRSTQMHSRVSFHKARFHNDDCLIYVEHKCIVGSAGIKPGS